MERDTFEKATEVAGALHLKVKEAVARVDVGSPVEEFHRVPVFDKEASDKKIAETEAMFEAMSDEELKIALVKALSEESNLMLRRVDVMMDRQTINRLIRIRKI